MSLKNWMIIASVVGIASVLTAILYFQPQVFANIAAKEPHVDLTIEGLKESYTVGESIDFIVRVEGYGCDRGFPSVTIVQDSTEQAVWSRLGEIRSFPAGYSCPYENIYHVKHIGDVERYNNDKQDRMRTQGSVPIVMTIEGKYSVQVEDLVKEFAVIAG